MILQEGDPAVAVILSREKLLGPLHVRVSPEKEERPPVAGSKTKTFRGRRQRRQSVGAGELKGKVLEEGRKVLRSLAVRGSSLMPRELTSSVKLISNT